MTDSCGTTPAYRQHLRHHQLACPPCLAAARRYRTSLRRPPGTPRQLYNLQQAIAVLAEALLPGFTPTRKHTMTQGLDSEHICFGCQKRIGDGDPHIHVPLDEWAATVGLGALGLDDILTTVFCQPCTVEARKGWRLESHPIKETP